ncbi:MAG: tetratricopeptide repeat protein, partial [Acidobacteria bacterium]|nr:tetratricopeptide repeat protein [Acidobacteriota bacterium]
LQAIHCVDDADDRQSALCCSLLANCYLEAGQPEQASHWARRGLELRETRVYERATLLYGLARALEAQGNGEEALQRYNEVGEVIQNFRDISERVSRLGGCASQMA